MTLRLTLSALITSLAVIVAVVSSAADLNALPHEPALPVGADHAAEIARVRTGGRILDVKPAEGAQSAYEVRVLLNEGRIRKIVVDVESGHVE